MKYFSYGMNTNMQAMRSRCPRAKNLGAGVLADYRFEFKGCATITPDFENKVNGVLWEITDDCEKALDLLEGFPDFYYKINVRILVNGKYIPAMTYIMNPSLTLDYPSTYYLDLLDEGYTQNGISTDQLDRALLQIDLLKEKQTSPYYSLLQN